MLIALGRMERIGKTFKPVALVWKSEANEVDQSKAETFAAAEGYKVFVFPDSETDPLGRVKKELGS